MKMERSITVFIALAMLVTLSAATDYCHLQSCRNKPHTACIFPRPGPSNQCTGYQGSGLSENEKRKIVDLHNELRQKVASGKETAGSHGPQPRAKYMPNLEWDDEIASIAQRWADQCTWRHDTCRNVERFPVGQNIAYEGTSGDINTIKVESMVQSWYNEVQYFNRQQVLRFTGTASYPRKMIGHYTQMVWAKTTKIGCGATKYKEGIFNKFYLVCNYGPAGNFVHQPIYEIA